jgi:acetylornithine deacetylase/succinyl-diaminopimelate desuccinylase-like protein
MSEETTTPPVSAIKLCEEKYPETTAEFKKILKEQYEIFCKKQMNYGPDNISVGTRLETPEEIKLSQTGLWFRMNDKIQRLKQLVLLGHQDTVGESVLDTYQDLSVYNIIAQIVIRGKWAK